MNLCPDCKHAAHEPGQCPFDECGISETCHSKATKRDIDIVPTYFSFEKAEVVTRRITRLKPRNTGND